MTFLYTYNIQN